MLREQALHRSLRIYKLLLEKVTNQPESIFTYPDHNIVATSAAAVYGDSFISEAPTSGSINNSATTLNANATTTVVSCDMVTSSVSVMNGIATSEVTASPSASSHTITSDVILIASANTHALTSGAASSGSEPSAMNGTVTHNATYSIESANPHLSGVSDHEATPATGAMLDPETHTIAPPPGPPIRASDATSAEDEVPPVKRYAYSKSILICFLCDI